MRRRVHVPTVAVGRLELGAAESHHLRDVLRLERGGEVEMFDSAGRSAIASIVEADVDGVVVDVVQLAEASTNFAGLRLTIAAAIPKGDRADWMVEKLSELGVAALVPLHAERSVVLPTGRGKAERWQRLAVESAKQSRRTGVMAIDPLTSVADALRATGGAAMFASTELAGEPLSSVIPVASAAMTLFVGPEGGWTDAELRQFAGAGAAPVRLTSTVLRIETAAVAAAAVLLCR